MSRVPVKVRLPVRISAAAFRFGPEEATDLVFGGLIACRTRVKAKLISDCFIADTSAIFLVIYIFFLFHLPFLPLPTRKHNGIIKFIIMLSVLS